jgi:hypothetical protein
MPPEPDKPLRLEWLDPGQLDAHPRNWKLHPGEQLDALESGIKRVGWAGALLFNERTGRLLDGHGRRERFKGKGAVPVLVGSWDEAAEAEVLATLDPLGWMARTDGAAFDQLTAAGGLLDGLGADPQFAALLAAVRESAEVLGPPAEPGGGPGAGAARTDAGPGGSPGPRRPAAAEVPDALWPSDNPFGIPLLDLALQADAVEFPVTLWGSQGQTRSMRGTWCFYAHDETFEPLWANPGKVLPSGAPCLVEPNWSTSDQTPLILSLYSIFKRRFVARYWQSQGRRVFVDINVHQSLLEPCEATGGAAPALLGVPAGWQAYATRAHADRPEMLLKEFDVACAHAGGRTPLFLVYGGGKRVKALAEAHGWV